METKWKHELRGIKGEDQLFRKREDVEQYCKEKGYVITSIGGFAKIIYWIKNKKKGE